jgi:nucleotide-binding universal stress UspA family protein
MVQITRILCPVDLSEISRRALEHAAVLARWYGARLTVLYVIPSSVVAVIPPLVTDGREHERTMADVQRFAAQVTGDVPIDVLCAREATDVHREIVEQARTTHADLLVVGSHGRSGFERLLLGSVTEKLMHKAPCPMMIVPPGASDSPVGAPVQFRGILCPVDFSDASRHALAFATALAEEADARLTVLHVIEMPPELRENPLSEGFDVDGIRAAAEAAGLRRLRETIPEEAHTYCTVETAVREGAAYREILKEAAARTVDLIVMGVHGRGALDLAIFGSNTARVARAATCPVLIVGMGR